MQKEERTLREFYLAFEDRFRGDSAEISQRLSIYLPYLSQTPAGTQPVIDIGCGRGEWLQLLRDAGYAGIGIDSDPAMVEHCRNRGLEVIEADALEQLRALQEGSVRGVSAFHILEHVPFAVMLQLLREIIRVLRPGGVALLETPNPHNMLVGACHFYTDPTHVRPIPSQLLSFAAEYCGFATPSVLFLHPAAEGHWIREQGDTIEHRFNDLFYGPQDYSLIAFKT